jgi:phosphoribosylanthranilate isomerase
MNQSLLVKICGLSTPATLTASLDAGADMVGLVFFPASPRHVDLGTARDLGRLAKGRAQTVALTVDADDALLANIVEMVRPDMLQLHGHESIARVRDIKQQFGVPVMKVLPVATAADLASAPGYAAVADRLLFDAKPPKDATRPGGLGAAFDWTLLDQLPAGQSFMLSGGLHAGNVGEAIRATKAAGVDVSSGVETTPGVKDTDLIQAFIRAARASETR